MSIVKEAISESKKVKWLTKEKLLRSFGQVLAFCIVLGGFCSVVDIAALFIVALFY